ncbi:MAG: type 4 fimbrial biogenesis protein PilF [marine bacterium B5-7]|nr:MAG: type 4 fimbrial biogenesis protein PilF [marine bacterium B5-7]
MTTLTIMLSACVTTSTGGIESEKWDKKDRAVLHTRLGIDYMQQGQLETALDELDLALRIDPSSSDAHLAMARLDVRLERMGDAESHFAKAVRLNSDNVAARNDYGYFLCSNGQFSQGLEQLTLALNNPFNKTPYVSLYGAAECKRQEGDIDKAIEYYEQTLALQPDMRPALRQMAYLNFERGQYLQARAFIERFFQDQNYTADSLYLAVRNELKLKRRDVATEYARLLRARFPDSNRIDDLRGLFEGLSE